jgi:hypothetical protein
MVFAQRFTETELIKLSELPEEEIKSLNNIHDIAERIKTAKNKMLKYCG